MEYSQTLNLPKTDFPMRANLPENELKMCEYWENIDIYGKLMEKNKSNEVFFLHDGPPYANGEIHVGHAMNKILKDVIVRYKNMTGFRAPFIPGFDTHGLPTELKARKKAGVMKNTDISAVELRKICRDTANFYVDLQKKQFKRLGILADWENCYVTLNPEFEKSQIEVFAKMAEKGMFYRGMKPVHWCPNCQTALAEAEIDYSNDDCESLYVKFQVKEDFGKFKALGADLSRTYFVIWTTTAWSLPGNVAICLNAEFDYVLFQIDDEFFIVAEKLLAETLNLRKKTFEECKILGKFKGSQLEKMTACHPFLKRESLVILGDHVTLESGTGCVHTAPGHGEEDFYACQRYDLEVLMPIDDNGKMNKKSEILEGVYVKKADKLILDILRKNDRLFATKNIKHQYPHCWRCKEPIITRATEQWFCSLNSLKEESLKAAESVQWIPSWGKERMKLMLEKRGDWCISRQRKWGVPIPVFYCSDCNEPLISPKIMLNIAKIFGEKGSDAWFTMSADELLPSDVSCPKCGSNNFRKEKDVMDVWFDAGSTHEAVSKKIKFPADIYFEGGDQFRGWFQSSLWTSLAVNGLPPYKTVISNGWVIDEDGQKQSKSRGNGISPDSVCKQFGADILRAWVASCDYRSDVKISNSILSQISEYYRKIRNTARFIIGNLYDFDPNVEKVCNENFSELDKYILYKFKNLFQMCISAYDNYEFHTIFHLIHKFCVTDLSNFYLDVVKDTLYVEASNKPERRAVQTVLHTILSAIVKLIHPILPFTSEEIWKFIPHFKSELSESVILNEIKFDIDINFSKNLQKKWEKIQKFCDEARKILEISRKNKLIGSSLEADVSLYCCDSEKSFFLEQRENLKKCLIVSGFNVFNLDKKSGSSVKLENFEDVFLGINRFQGKKCERCWNYFTNESLEDSNNNICNRCKKILDEKCRL